MVSSKSKFVLNRAAFRDQVLKGSMIVRPIRSATKKAADRSIIYRDMEGKNRNGSVLIAPGAVEAKHGTLTQAVGRIRV